MPFVSRTQIDPKLRTKHERAYKDTLRQALVNPALTEEQRVHLKLEIKSVGGPKKYLADSPPKPGAVLLAVPERSKKKSPAKNKAPKRAGGKQ